MTFLAVSISTLGLLAMAAFKVETRMKEICIRKILGAGTHHLFVPLSRSFKVMVIIAAAIAIPVSLYLVDHFILYKFQYRAQVGISEILSGFLIVLLIGVFYGWLADSNGGCQNPADILRDE